MRVGLFASVFALFLTPSLVTSEPPNAKTAFFWGGVSREIQRQQLAELRKISDRLATLEGLARRPDSQYPIGYPVPISPYGLSPRPQPTPPPYVAPTPAPAPYVAPEPTPPPYVAPAPTPAPYVAPEPTPPPYVAPAPTPPPYTAPLPGETEPIPMPLPGPPEMPLPIAPGPPLIPVPGPAPPPLVPVPMEPPMVIPDPGTSTRSSFVPARFVTRQIYPTVWIHNPQWVPIRRTR